MKYCILMAISFIVPSKARRGRKDIKFGFAFHFMTVVRYYLSPGSGRPSSHGRSSHPAHLHGASTVSSLMSYQMPARLHVNAPVSFTAVCLLTQPHATRNLSCICKGRNRIAARASRSCPFVYIDGWAKSPCPDINQREIRWGAMSLRHVEVTAQNVLETGREIRG